MPHPGLILFGACAVVAVAVVVIEEWPAIKETYLEVRSRRRRRMTVDPHEHHRSPNQHPSTEDVTMTASGFHEPLQEMTMRSRNTDVKSGVQVIRPFAVNPPEQRKVENVGFDEDGLISVQRFDSPTRFPIFTEDVSPLIRRVASPNKSPSVSQTLIPDTLVTPILDECSETPALIDQDPVFPELINPLDRPSSPTPESADPFADPAGSEIQESATRESQYVDAEESVPMSRSTSHTLSIGAADDETNSMSDWTEAFDNDTESEVHSDNEAESESDIMSDAESEASWARVRGSRNAGFN